MKYLTLLTWFLAFYSIAFAKNREEPDLLIADFEGETYGDWKTTGEAFGPGPAKGTLPNQMHVTGYKGKGLVNSYFQGDDSVGTLTSPSFKLERKFINFLIGGGKNQEKLTMNLIIENKVVRKSTGSNDKPGGSELLEADSWDVGEFLGKNAVIQIVDQAQGGWGHILVDHIVQSNKKAALSKRDVLRDFQIEKKYLNIPIKNGSPAKVLTLLVDGREEVQNGIELADGEPDWWAVMDVSKYHGRKITLKVDKLADDSKALSSIVQSEHKRDSKNLYQEKNRGQFHFSSQRGWLNDPNGLVYFNGEYHLFYQHNPYGWSWGNMHWGHAVSNDLLHWKELGDALAPDRFGPMFSGSAVVDWKNTSGFGTEGKPPIVLIYTAAGNPTTQCIAFSTDGRTFTKYDRNPVLPQITGGNRDPKVFWYEPTQKWVMVLYVELQGKHTVHFFNSANLKDWTLASIIESPAPKTNLLFECPDFFELPIDGDKNQRKWILTAANSEYLIGQFDGKKFTPESGRLTGQRGRGFYAAQTYSDVPSKDGRRIQIGWFQTVTPGVPFNQSMTIPLELKLTSTSEGPRMTWNPVREMDSLRVRSKKLAPITLKEGSENPLAEFSAELVEIRLEFEPGKESVLNLNVRGAQLSYDSKTEMLSVNNVKVHAPMQMGKQQIAVYCDRTGLEVFASNGLIYVPMPFQPKAADKNLSLKVTSGVVQVNSLQVHELASIWK